MTETYIRAPQQEVFHPADDRPYKKGQTTSGYDLRHLQSIHSMM